MEATTTPPTSQGEILDASVAAHNAVMQLATMYGLLLEQKQRELALANARTAAVQGELQRARSSHEAQLVEGRAANARLSGIVDELRARLRVMESASGGST
jgi:uncharacterized protein involved in exopolysaccharide biosynthesis